MTGFLALDILIGIVGLYVLALLLFPLLLLTNYRMNGNFVLQAIDPKEISLPDEVRAYFSRCFQQLSSAGFQFVTVYLIPDLLDNVTCVMALFENRTAKCLAISVNMYASNEFETIQDQHVQISGTDKLGNTYTTNNSHQVNAFKPTADRRLYQFPDTRNATQLFKLYQGVLQAEMVDLKPIPERGQLEASLRAELMREMRSQINTGYLKELPNHQFVPTVKGAYMMMWKNMYPITQIYWLLVRAKASRLKSGIRG